MATYQLATAWALLKNYQPHHGKASTTKGGDPMTKTTPTRLGEPASVGVVFVLNHGDWGRRLRGTQAQACVLNHHDLHSLPPFPFAPRQSPPACEHPNAIAWRHRKHEERLTVRGKKMASKANFWTARRSGKTESCNKPKNQKKTLLATLLEHCKVLVEENLGAHRTLDHHNLENCDLYIAASLLTLRSCFWRASGVNTGYTKSLVRTQGETPWLSKVETSMGQSPTSFEVIVQGQHPNKGSNLGHPVGFFFCRKFLPP